MEYFLIILAIIIGFIGGCIEFIMSVVLLTICLPLVVLKIIFGNKK